MPLVARSHVTPLSNLLSDARELRREAWSGDGLTMVIPLPSLTLLVTVRRTQFWTMRSTQFKVWWRRCRRHYSVYLRKRPLCLNPSYFSSPPALGSYLPTAPVMSPSTIQYQLSTTKGSSRAACSAYQHFHWFGSLLPACGINYIPVHCPGSPLAPPHLGAQDAPLFSPTPNPCLLVPPLFVTRLTPFQPGSTLIAPDVRCPP